MRATNPSPVTDTPYVHQEYPKMLYHKDEAPQGQEVTNPDQEAELVAKGYVDTPAAFDPKYVKPKPMPPAPTAADAEKLASENAALKKQIEDLQKKK